MCCNICELLSSLLCCLRRDDSKDDESSIEWTINDNVEEREDDNVVLIYDTGEEDFIPGYYTRPNEAIL